MHRVPLPDGVPGQLWLTGFSVVGPDPGGTLEGVGADRLVCLITDDEIEMRFPAYAAWLAGDERAVHHPIPDWGTVDDDRMLALVGSVAAMLRRGEVVVVHCGAGIGRAGCTAIGALVALGMDLAEATTHVRAHRPGAGPDSGAQRDQLDRLAVRITRWRHRTVRLPGGPDHPVGAVLAGLGATVTDGTPPGLSDGDATTPLTVTGDAAAVLGAVDGTGGGPDHRPSRR